MNFDETFPKDNEAKPPLNLWRGPPANSRNGPQKLPASLWRRARRARLANLLHAEAGLPLHHPAKAKRVIYLFQSGDPLKSTYSITSQGSRKRPVRNFRIPHARDNASPACRATKPVSSSALLSSFPNMDRAGNGSANSFRTPPRLRTKCASSIRCTPRPSITVRVSPSCKPDPNHPGAPQHGGLVILWLGLDQ